jgi:hypothetical protein
MFTRDETVRCANRSTGTGIGGIRQCYNEPATVEVTVTYGQRFSGGDESDTHILCDECGSELKRDARSHGYEVKTKRLHAMSAADERKARTRANAKLNELGKTYHDGLALDKIGAILKANGFDELESAIYCGRDGDSHEQVGERTWLRLSWHKMESGRYEIVAYLS